MVRAMLKIERKEETTDEKESFDADSDLCRTAELRTSISDTYHISGWSLPGVTHGTWHQCFTVMTRK